MGSTGNYRDVIINGNNLDRILSEGTGIFSSLLLSIDSMLN
jgi:hypothetical protein